jgi:Uma2 family endonuclease
MAAATQAVPTLLTLEQYLQTSYHPDCDFVDGVLEERNVGGTKHGLLQMQLGYWFVAHRKHWCVRAVGELRTLIGNRTVRIPDVAIVADDEALNEELRMTPLFIAIEILSPDDRFPRVIPRLRDFLTMGVPHVWLLDPVDRVAYTYSEHGLKLVEEPRIAIPGSPIYIDLPEIFASLD